MAGSPEARFYEDRRVWDCIKNDPNGAARVAAIRAVIPADAHAILDLGCGIGSLTNTIDAPMVVGLDRARTPLASVTTERVQGSIAALPFKTGTFDCVVVTDVLEHLDEETLVAAVAEILRLRPKHVVVAVPDREDLANEQVRCADCGHVFNPYHHRWSFDLPALDTLFYGFTPEAASSATAMPTRNRWLTRAKRRCGVYDRSDTAVCDRCGGPAARPSGILYYGFDAVGRVLFHAKRTIGVTAHYHLIVRFDPARGHIDWFPRNERARERVREWHRIGFRVFDRYLAQAMRDREARS